jgi:L-aspartate oxidase
MRENHEPAPQHVSAGNGPAPASANHPGRNTPGPEEIIHAIRDLTWKNAGIVRTGSGLRSAIQQLEQWRECLPPSKSRRACEARNLHETALLIARSALAREESRGAHYRLDFPIHNDAKFRKHTVVQGKSVRFVE